MPFPCINLTFGWPLRKNFNENQSHTFVNFFVLKHRHFEENLRILKDFSNFGDGISDYNQFIMLNEVPVRYHFS